MSKVTQLASGELSGSKVKDSRVFPETKLSCMKRSEPLAGGELEGRHEGENSYCSVPAGLLCPPPASVPTASSTLKAGGTGVLGWGPKPQGNTLDPLRAFCPQIRNMKIAKEAAVRGVGLVGGGRSGSWLAGK